MLVVGYLYNDNGMATWCWEAAHALHRAGQPVILAASHEVTLPGEAEMEVVRLHSVKRSSSVLMRNVRKIIQILYPIAHPEPDGLLQELHEELLRRGKQPTAYLLNQTTMIDDRISTSQYVVAWAYPVSLRGYLAKTNLMLQSKHPLAKPRMFLWILGMWRADWRAYRQAAGVLAVTRTLRDALSEQDVNAFCVHPGTRTLDTLPRPVGGVRQILIAATLLDEPRKRIEWMLESLAGVDDFDDCELVLAGISSPAIEAAAKRLKFPTKFLGRLRRDELQKLMGNCDIFCFGSKMDDWGYVVAEAVSNGMIVVAPDQSPFDEIVDDTGFMFDPASSSSFVDSLRKAVSLSPKETYQLKENAKVHAATVLSNKVFAQVLLGVIEGSEMNRRAASGIVPTAQIGG
jgi:glycosyltransferase involved in cell wall biosynthesis